MNVHQAAAYLVEQAEHANTLREMLRREAERRERVEALYDELRNGLADIFGEEIRHEGVGAILRHVRVKLDEQLAGGAP